METYEKALGDGSFLGKGSFGHVEKVRRKADSKVCRTMVERLEWYYTATKYRG